MKTISQSIETIKNILNKVERTEEYTGNMSVEIDEQCNNILAVNGTRDEPMKIKEIHVDEYFCPSCGSENGCNDGIISDKYCPKCGQRLNG